MNENNQMLQTLDKVLLTIFEILVDWLEESALLEEYNIPKIILNNKIDKEYDSPFSNRWLAVQQPYYRLN